MRGNDTIAQTQNKGNATMANTFNASEIFPIKNRMYGMNALAIELNALVKSGKIGDWHPGRWVDHEHSGIEIGFNSTADAQVAIATIGRRGP